MVGDKTMNKKISIVYTYFNQHDMLNLLFKYYDKFIDKELLNNIEFIIVDDCSEEHPAVTFFPETKNINYSIWKTNKKVYNPGGARNLGILKCTNNNVVSVDLDMVLTNDVLIELFNSSLSDTMYFRFFRDRLEEINLDTNIRFYKKLNSPFFIKKELFLKYPFDEEFSGHYGYEDEYWRAVLLKNNINSIFCEKGIITAPIRFTGYTTYDTPRNNPGYTKGIDRETDLIITRKLYDKKMRQLKQAKLPFYISMKLNFDYELIKTVNV